jgi:hypothetical protein
MVASINQTMDVNYLIHGQMTGLKQVRRECGILTDDILEHPLIMMDEAN